MRKTIISVMALVAAMTAGAEEKRVTSPDGGLAIDKLEKEWFDDKQHSSSR